MRQLVYVPIIHTEADLGSMAQSFKKEFKKRYSDHHYECHVDAIATMWQGISEKIIKPNTDWQKVRLYQDGLPVCGREKEIVSDLARNGSVNHELLVDLISRGAHLEGTEDRALLLKEYDYLNRIFKAKNQAEKNRTVKEYQKVSDWLLQERDRFMAQRIAHTLKRDETGILFVGMMHKVDKYLPKSIAVSSVIHRLPFNEFPTFVRT